LGQRQDLVKIGHTFITQGAEAAIKLFLTETSPNENSATTQVRQTLLKDWLDAERNAKQTESSVASQWPYFHGMQITLGNLHRALNLAVEQAIVEKTLELLDFEQVISVIDRELKSGPSLWIGAYQSFWFNQALAKSMRGEINLRNNSIPLYMRDDAAEKWYRSMGMKEAIPVRVNPFAERLFLTPRPPKPRKQQANNGRQFQQRRFRSDAPVHQFNGPCRKAFIPLRDLKCQAEDGVLNISFMLRSGAYATTFLGMLFDLDQDDKVLSDERLSY
jgi:tRNA(Glu) U13 pseudouridine synthase TruD